MNSSNRALAGWCSALCLALGMGGLACAGVPAAGADSSSDDSASPTVTYSVPTSADAGVAADPSAASSEVAADGPCAIGVRTAAGCTATYDIASDTMVEGFSSTCASGETLYNGCSANPLALRWKDMGPTAPKSVRIELQTSMFCADPDLPSEQKQMQTLQLNAGASIGSFEGDLAACTCSAEGTVHAFDLSPAALAEYAQGSDNSVRLDGPNRCRGMKKHEGWGNAVARVTVSY